MIATPHFLLFSDVRRNTDVSPEANSHWTFVLEAADGSTRVAAADEEPEARGERLQLLAVVRGLEALNQPSRVTLVTPSRYVSRGLRRGLNIWKDNNWLWERYGKMVPVRDADLWQRVEQALQFHEVDCKTWRIDAASGASLERSSASEQRPAESVQECAAILPAARQRNANSPSTLRQISARVAGLIERLNLNARLWLSPLQHSTL